VWNDFGGHRDRVGRLTCQVIEQREVFDFMMVARAMVLAADYKSLGAGKKLADELGISRQTRYNWFKRDLPAWLDEVEHRVLARSIENPPPRRPRKTYITEDDWVWILELLGNLPMKSWEYRAARVRAAARSGSRVHLERMDRSTLWRNRGRFLSVGSHPGSVRMGQSWKEKTPEKDTSPDRDNPF
jgi:hypothetical protein